MMLWATVLILVIVFETEGRQPAERTAWNVGQTIKTTSGAVTGHAAKEKTQVSEYLGIPFAKPPIGELRWAAPVKFSGSGNINASQYVSTPKNNVL
jgi:cholinesterase